MKVYILRGIPGSGKSHVAQMLLAKHYGEISKVLEPKINSVKDLICSADHYMVNDKGEYEFNLDKLSSAHSHCYQKFQNLVKEWGELPVVVVDNTNIRLTEVAPYYQLAASEGREVMVRTIVVNPSVAAKRCAHGVSPTQIYNMYLMLDDETRRLPPWWNHEVVFV